MKPKTIIITLIGCFVFLGLFVWGYVESGGLTTPVKDKNTVELGSSKSLFTVPEIFYDFGTISMARGKVDTVFSVTNSTNKDITLKTVTTSCMCTKAFIKKGNSEIGPFGMPGMGFIPPANELIKAGETSGIKVVYDPAAHGPAGVGPIDRFVYLTDSNGGNVQLEIKATVTP